MLENNYKQIANMRRCTRCLLPESFPFIAFDHQGVCSYCNHNQPMRLAGQDALQAKAAAIRRSDAKPDCIVMFSGGRDSSYLLHYVVAELRLNPLVFTYDWGMSTPVGERNARRMCQKLGVERIIIDGNRPQKLHNIRSNVNAWLHRPSLGMVPLFMAGDKYFFAQVNKIAVQRGISSIFIGTNPLEKTDFKWGFCGVKPNFSADRLYHLSSSGKLGMLAYYGGQFLRNPAYINASLLDSAKGFLSFYQAQQDEIDLYKYIWWDETTINTLLINEYGWETAPDTPTTWRIGDGTAAFYNYIYYTVAGFTENDALRSNQIREGVLGREQALEMVQRENMPRPQSIAWYLKRIGVHPRRAIPAINAMQKLY